MAPFTSDESYQNFLDEAQNDYLRAYYGANLDRLIAIKRRHDPQNIFHSPQSIPLRPTNPRAPPRISGGGEGVLAGGAWGVPPSPGVRWDVSQPGAPPAGGRGGVPYLPLSSVGGQGASHPRGRRGAPPPGGAGGVPPHGLITSS